MSLKNRIATYIASYEKQRSFFGLFPFGKPKSFRYRNLLELQKRTSPPTEYDVFQALTVDNSKSSPRFNGLIDTRLLEEHERLNSEKIRMHFINSLLNTSSSTTHPQLTCYNAIIQTVHDSLDQRSFDTYFSLLRSIQRTCPNAPINVETVQSVQRLIGTLKDKQLPLIPCLSGLKEEIEKQKTTDFLNGFIDNIETSTVDNFSSYRETLQSTWPESAQETSSHVKEKPRSPQPSSPSQPAENYHIATEIMRLSTVKEEEEEDDEEGESPN